MSADPLFVEGGSPFIAHIIRPADIPSDLRAAMTEVWDALMALRQKHQPGEILLSDSLTDLVLSQYTHRSGRFVQKGLKGLQDCGVILRHTANGRRNIEITGRIAGRKAKAPDETRPKPKPKAKRTESSSIPNLQTPVPETTPEQLAWAAAQEAAASADSDPEQPLSPAEAGSMIRQAMAAAAEAGAKEEPSRPKLFSPAPRRKLRGVLDPSDPRVQGRQADPIIQQELDRVAALAASRAEDPNAPRPAKE